MARGGLRRPDQALADLAKIPDDDPAAPRRACWPGRSSCGGTASAWRQRRCWPRSRWTRHSSRRTGELVYIDGMLLRRRELNEHFQALARLAPMTFDEVFSWCLTRNTVWEPHERARVPEEVRRGGPGRPLVARGPGRDPAPDRPNEMRRPSVLSVLPESDPDARAVRARIALDRGDDRAVEAILAGGPADHPELARLRGQFALAHRDGPAAVRHFRAAYAALPDDRDTVFGLGTALALVGDHAAAAPFLRDSKAYDTLGALLTRAANPANHNDAALMRALGAACEAVHRLPEARAWYNLAVQTNPLDEEAQKALYRLRIPAVPSPSVPGVRHLRAERGYGAATPAVSPAAVLRVSSSLQTRSVPGRARRASSGSRFTARHGRLSPRPRAPPVSAARTTAAKTSRLAG